jgi:RNA polymerase sigma-32 factor
MLTQAEETDLARSLRDRGDLQAAGRLVLSHLRWWFPCRANTWGYGLPQGD